MVRFLGGLSKKLARKLGLLTANRSANRNRKTAQFETTAATRRGRVLLSYVIDPFLDPEHISNAHTHFWESYAIGQSFLVRGYDLDVIHFENHHFEPAHRYEYFVSARTNFDSIAPKLNDDCVKVVHLDTAHWLYNNAAAYDRLRDLWRRRGIALVNAKSVGPNWALEHADLGTVLGNSFTISTYKYANKPLFRIPISAPQCYPWVENKDIAASKDCFLWFGSSGFVHKGLDLVLEAFASLPDKQLIVCGPVKEERRFCDAFHKELFDTPNITTIGWVDVASDEFVAIANKCIGLVYPTCSEGGGGSVITCMHAGIIPIVTTQASVDIDDAGIAMEATDIASIQETVQMVSNLPLNELQRLRRNAWERARGLHTREHFDQAFQDFVDHELLTFSRC